MYRGIVKFKDGIIYHSEENFKTPHELLGHIYSHCPSSELDTIWIEYLSSDPDFGWMPLTTISAYFDSTK